MKETVIYRVTGASDRTFRKLPDAVRCAATWLDAFHSVWITVVSYTDRTLHFVCDSRGILVVTTDIPGRGEFYMGVLGAALEDSERLIVRALENYYLT